MSEKLGLRLKHYFFPVQSVIGNRDFESDEARDNFSIKVDHAIAPLEEGNDSEYAIELTFTTNEDEEKLLPYNMKVSIFAVFELVNTDDSTERERECLVARTGLPMLIGVLREKIADMTSCGPWPKIYLPIVPLNELLEEYMDH